MHRSTKHADLADKAVTAAGGIGLGALSVGMPDIVLFLGNLLVETLMLRNIKASCWA